MKVKLSYIVGLTKYKGLNLNQVNSKWMLSLLKRQMQEISWDLFQAKVDPAIKLLKDYINMSSVDDFYESECYCNARLY